jgi:hypothetical protein
VIVINKKLRKIIPYSLVCFPSHEALRSMATSFPLTHLARVACASADLSDGCCIVDRSVHFTLHVDLRRPADRIFANLNATARTKVRRAEKLAGRVNVRHYSAREENNPRFLDEFVDLFNDLAKPKPGKLFPISRSLAESYFPNADLFLLDLDDRLVIAHLLMRDSQAEISRLLYSASRRLEDQDIAKTISTLNVYLHWYELRYYREAGFGVYDFGGISPVDDPGINRFKFQFGGALVRQYGYLFAGMPTVWRAAMSLFTSFTARGRRRKEVEHAGVRWNDLTLEQICHALEEESKVHG